MNRAGSLLLLVSFAAGCLGGSVCEASERRYRMASTGSLVPDLLEEVRDYVPLQDPQVRIRERYDYLLLRGRLASEEAGYISNHDPAVDCQNYKGWAEWLIQVENVAEFQLQREAGVSTPTVAAGESVTLVGRHAPVRREDGVPISTTYGTGSERHNRLQPGDEVYLVAVRPQEYGQSTVLYCPEFWPHYSIMFSAVIQSDGEVEKLCVVSASEIDTFRGDLSGRPWELLSQSAFARELHCYDVDVSSAIEMIRDLVELEGLR